MELDQTEDALLVIDMQLDFMPGGALAVAGGDQVVPLVNRLAARFDHVLLTADWHPPGHVSFATTHPGRQPYEQVQVAYGPQTLWPEHCVQHTPGAGLHPGLELAHAELLLRKGFRAEIDSYSAFLENDHRTPTGLAGYLRERGFRRLFVAGLAYDFCVRFTAVDGRALGFDMVVVEEATRAVGLPGGRDGEPGSVEATHASLAQVGVPRVSLAEL